VRLLSTKDRVWSWLLIVLPALILIASLIPGIMQMYDNVQKQYVACGLLNMPGEETAMHNIRLPLLAALAYWVILGVMYYRSQGLGTLKAIMIFGFLCAFLFAIALIVKANSVNITLVKGMPYGLLPIACLAVSVLSIVRLKMEEKNYEFD